MAIIDRIREMEESEQKQAKEEQDRATRTKMEEQNRVDKVAKAVVEALEELRTVGFGLEVFHRRGADFGETAVLKHPKMPTLVLGVKYLPYIFKGSDESPEEELHHVVVALDADPSRIICDEYSRLPGPAIRVNDGFGGPDDFKRMLQQFEEAVAKLIRTYIKGK
jgi:hypothetical protein